MKFTYAFFFIGLCYTINGAYSNHVQFWRRIEKYDDKIFVNQLNITEEPLNALSAISCGRLCTNIWKSSAFSFRKKNCYCYDSTTKDSNSYTNLKGAVYYTKEPVAKAIECTDKKYIYLGDVDLCFKVYTALITFTDAGDRCRFDGGHLITLDTAKKCQALSGFVLKNNYYWIGLKMESNLEWKWTNHISVNLNTSLWYPNEPNGRLALSPEDCGGYYYKNDIYGFIDIDCTSTNQFICEL